MAANAPCYSHGWCKPAHFTPVANAQASPRPEDGHGYSTALALDHHYATPNPEDKSPQASLPPHRRQHHPQQFQGASDGSEPQGFELFHAAVTAGAMKGACPASLGQHQAPDSGGSKRKRTDSSAPSAEAEDSQCREAGNSASAAKRPRTETSTLSSQHPLTSTPNTLASAADSLSLEVAGLQAGNTDELRPDARAVGVHSAAALFRRTTKEPARKYTRPPMSKLFMSLQLTPENFLQLQAHAKVYMLDPRHPERQSCVGNRGKGDTDMVKLKLFNCVRDFLAEGAGQQFFGEHVEKPAHQDTIAASKALGEATVTAEEKLLWPRDGNKIISLVTPLLRRMVTNERQRMYAIETRKGGSRKKDDTATAARNHDSPASLNSVKAITPSMSAGYSDGHSNLFSSVTHHHHVEAPIQSIEAQHDSKMMSPSRNAAHVTVSELSGLSLLASSPKLKERPLPALRDRTYNLRKITIFLSKNGLRLKQQEKITGPHALVHFSWDQLQERILALVTRSVEMYPELRTGPTTQTQQPTASLSALTGLEPEALRSLAVAATEAQRESVSLVEPSVAVTMTGSSFSPPEPHNERLYSSSSSSSSSSAARAAPTPLQEAIPPSPASPQARPDSALPAHSPSAPSSPSSGRPSTASHETAGQGLPPYTIKAMLTSGLTQINDKDHWESAKEDVATAVWANGKLSVVVEC